VPTAVVGVVVGFDGMASGRSKHPGLARCSRSSRPVGWARVLVRVRPLVDWPAAPLVSGQVTYDRDERVREVGADDEVGEGLSSTSNTRRADSRSVLSIERSGQYPVAVASQEGEESFAWIAGCGRRDWWRELDAAQRFWDDEVDYGDQGGG
jgi:hypothetical protein